MAYDESLADRIFSDLQRRGVDFDTREMMGGLCFLVDGKMMVGIVREELMARIGPDAYGSVLERHGVREMDFTGRPMKGYVFVDPSTLREDSDLAYWIQLALDFNPLAKSSRKKK